MSAFISFSPVLFNYLLVIVCMVLFVGLYVLMTFADKRIAKRLWGSNQTGSASSAIPTVAYDPNPENPNRCMRCLSEPVARKAHGYVPASDSVLYDTDLCGGCGTFGDVCDPSLFDVYRREGIRLSALGVDDGNADPYQLVRLRIRADGLAGSDARSPALSTLFTLEDAIESARIYKAARNSRPMRRTMNRLRSAVRGRFPREVR